MNKAIISAALALCCVAGAAAQGSATAKYMVNFYGQIKSDFVYDKHGVTGDDYMQYVASERNLDRDFRASARGTRFGLDITDGDKVSAKIETDLRGDDTGNAGMRLRHAYVTMKGGKWEILAGQTWHLLPLEFSGTNNEFALGYSGVLWMRTPQLRATYKAGDKLSFAAALAHPTRVPVDNNGTASGLPQAQAQVQYKAGKARFTLMGAYGKWRNTTDMKIGEVQLVDLGYNIPLGPMLTLNGQVWTGQNLYDFLGGIGQMGYGGGEVKASGGFANLAIRPAGRYSYNLAYGVDNPVDSTVPASATAKTKNTTLLANVGCVAYDKVTVTLEAAKQTTEYKLTTGYNELDNLHYQLSFRFPF
ncbi:MAG: outer membrane protein [Elusimicrobia bacterium]|nr:MAG: outer membrane protein [Elusimicrobiota bacterium]